MGRRRRRRSSLKIRRRRRSTMRSRRSQKREEEERQQPLQKKEEASLRDIQPPHIQKELHSLQLSVSTRTDNNETGGKVNPRMCRGDKCHRTVNKCIGCHGYQTSIKYCHARANVSTWAAIRVLSIDWCSRKHVQLAASSGINDEGGLSQIRHPMYRGKSADMFGLFRATRLHLLKDESACG